MTFEEWWKGYTGSDKDKSLVMGKVYAQSAWDYQQARIEALTTEVEEQARLLGASGSREAELLARVEALEKQNEILQTECRGYDCCPLAPRLNRADDRVEALEKKLTKVYNALLAGIANAAAANYAEREMEAKRRLRDAMQEPSP